MNLWCVCARAFSSKTVAKHTTEYLTHNKYPLCVPALWSLYVWAVGLELGVPKSLMAFCAGSICEKLSGKMSWLLISDKEPLCFFFPVCHRTQSVGIVKTTANYQVLGIHWSFRCWLLVVWCFFLPSFVHIGVFRPLIVCDFITATIRSFFHRPPLYIAYVWYSFGFIYFFSWYLMHC